MAFTKDGIMAQIWVAFGQGTGQIRVSQEAAWKLRELYYDAITQNVINNLWETEAVQVLERIRAIGRLAATRAVTAGRTAISVEDVTVSAGTVQLASDTSLCPP